jgi:hypothetical protein
MSGTLREKLLSSTKDVQVNSEETRAIKLPLDDTPQLAAIPSNIMEQVLSWMYTQRCVVADISQLVHLFAAAKVLQVPTLQDACLEAAQNLLAEARDLSAATTVCDEAKRLGSVREMWDCGYENLSSLLRQQRQSSTSSPRSQTPLHVTSTAGCHFPSTVGGVGAFDSRVHGSVLHVDGASACKVDAKHSLLAEGAHRLSDKPEAKAKEDSCRAPGLLASMAPSTAAGAAGDPWPQSFTACSRVHALAEKWCLPVGAAMPAHESEWESLVRRARMAGATRNSQVVAP